MLHLITGRLELVELSAYNAGFIVELLNSPGWLKYIGDKNVRTTDDAIAYLVDGPLKSYRENNFGPLLVKLRESNTAIGICGLLRRDYLEYPDIGFALLPEFEGMGYACEAAQAVLAGASAKRVATVGAILSRDNVRSMRLLERLGFMTMGTVSPPGSDEELLLMEINLSS